MSGTKECFWTRVSFLGWLAGWPDEFEKKIAQNVAQPIFLSKLMQNLTIEKRSPKIWTTSVIFIHPS
jgi:hypothetical protein